MQKNEWKWPLGVIAFVIGAAIFFHYQPHKSADVAAWVQAFGSIGAIIAAVSAVQWQHNLSRKADEALRREKYCNLLLTAQTAAQELIHLIDSFEDMVSKNDNILFVFIAMGGMIEDVNTSVRSLPLVEFFAAEHRHVAILRRVNREIVALHRAAAVSTSVKPSATPPQQTIAMWREHTNGALNALSSKLGSWSE